VGSEVMSLMNVRVLLGLAISGVCLYFVSRQINLDELATTLARTDPVLAALTVLAIPPAMFVKALRWRLFFPDPKAAGRAGLVPALYIGYMVNTIAPLRMGELVRAYLVGHHDRLGVSTVLATIVLEKLFDVASLLIILVVLALTTPLPDWAVAASYASAVGLAVGVVGTLIALVAEQRLLGFAAAVESRLPMLQRLGPSRLLESFLAGLRAVKEPRTLLWTVIWSAVLWVGGGIGLYTAIASVGVPATGAMVFFLMVVSNLGMSVPSAPGYVGVYHALVVLSLTVFGVAETAALSVGIVLHTAVFGAFLVGGLIYLWRGHFALSQILAGARQTAEEAHVH
jgi:uncharacterized protein (TIRG00374 family)